jgi:hypothetical protein
MNVHQTADPMFTTLKLAAAKSSAAEEAGPSRRELTPSSAFPEARAESDSPLESSRPSARSQVTEQVTEQLELAARGASPAEPRELPDASHPSSPPRKSCPRGHKGGNIVKAWMSMCDFRLSLGSPSLASYIKYTQELEGGNHHQTGTNDSTWSLSYLYLSLC